MRLRILFVSSEAAPYAKSGGLGEAVSSLASTLARIGHDVRVLLPRYYFINPAELERMSATLPAPGQRRAALLTAPAEGEAPQFYFLDFEAYYGRDGIYGSREEPNFSDNPARFAFLCRSAVLLGETLDWYPDILHIHDWPCGLVPLYRNLLQPPNSPAVVLTVHNGGYQGDFASEWVDELRIPQEHAQRAGIYHFDRMNFLKSAIVSSDAITTVSPTFAAELEAEETGFGLTSLYRARHDDFTGILNGIDYTLWNPENDRHLSSGFTEESLDTKELLKSELQTELGLSVDERPALIGMITRLAEQKGIRELFEPGYGCMARMLEELPIQVALLGNGAPWCEAEIRRLSERYVNFSCAIGFDEGLAHRIEAGSDFFLMPSRYEPCGLNQMYSLRYGTVPIVTRTGGLADTVKALDRERDEGTGYFIPRAKPWDIFDAVRDAVAFFHGSPEAMKRLRARGMQERFSWNHSSKRYLEVYRKALEKRR